MQERALILAHSGAHDTVASSSRMAMLEAENIKLKGELAHRTSQLHSAVARIAALKERIDDLLRKNDEVNEAKVRLAQKFAAKERRRKAKLEGAPAKAAEQEATSTLLATQDTMLSAIENLSAVPRATTAGVLPLAWVESEPPAARDHGAAGGAAALSPSTRGATSSSSTPGVVADVHARLRQYERRFGPGAIV